LLADQDDHLAYLEVKPGDGGDSKGVDQMVEAENVTELMTMEDGGFRHFCPRSINGYMVEELPDYSQNPVELLENAYRGDKIG